MRKINLDLTDYQKVSSKKCTLLKKSTPWTTDIIKLLDENLNYFCSLDFESDTFGQLLKSPYFKRDEKDLKFFYFDTKNITIFNDAERKSHISKLIRLLDTREAETTIEINNSCRNCNYTTLALLNNQNKDKNDIKLYVCQKCGYVVGM